MRPRPQSSRSIYFSDEALEMLRREAVRQGRPLSWIVRQAVIIAAPTLALLPGAP